MMLLMIIHPGLKEGVMITHERKPNESCSIRKPMMDSSGDDALELRNRSPGNSLVKTDSKEHKNHEKKVFLKR